jgi:simple sugar transport system permease protein
MAVEEGRFAIVILGAFLFTTLVLLIAGAPPFAAYQHILFGAFSNPMRFSDMMMIAAPLLLCSTGLTLTFAIGLYNLGIEGQVVMGAIFAMIPLQFWPQVPPLPLWISAFMAGMVGGALWALITALLRIYGRVSEIFAGLGMNFLATGVALYLVFGPWKRPGTASMSGTEELPEWLWLPTIEQLRVAPAAPVIALLAFVVVWVVLARTHWGLAIRAAGLNSASSRRLGVPATRRLLEAMAWCGALAGVAGTIQVLGVFHALVPNVSSGIGLLALLVVLLAQIKPFWVLPIAVMFASFIVGSIRLPLVLQIDSSISGVLQGALVLFALAARGWKQRRPVVE